MLLEAMNTPGISKSAILDVITAQKTRFGVRDLLAAAYSQEANEKAALFRIIGEIADAVERLGARRAHPGQGPDRARAHHQHPGALQHARGADARCSRSCGTRTSSSAPPPSRPCSAWTGPIDIERVTALLSDPEIDVQNKAIDVVIKANHPETIKYLIEVLKDENEYARRAAVEVLNEVGTANSVRHLLGALKDSDWWVRSRAADALGKIGGPEGHRGRAAARAGQGRRRAPRRHRDPQPDERRARGRQPHQGHARHGLVGERARSRCACRDRQQEGAAAPHGDAHHREPEGDADRGARAGQARRREAGGLRCCPSWRGRSARFARKRSRRSRSSPTSAARTRCARSCRRRPTRRTRRIARMAHQALAELDNRIMVGASMPTAMPTPTAMPQWRHAAAHRLCGRRRRRLRPRREQQRTLLMSESSIAAAATAGRGRRRSSTSRSSSPATSSRAATSTSIASAAAPSAPCC